MKVIRLTNLDGHVFSVTPTADVVVDVIRAVPGIVRVRAKSGAWVERQAAPDQVARVGPEVPLLLYPNDEVVLPSPDAYDAAEEHLYEQLCALELRGQAEIVEVPDPETTETNPAPHSAAESE